ncbi:MAG: hypothetical protein DRN42_02870 [Thermoplasmata archaeon]|nr:MAG: hypothetical protein DRN42_02870 [Thermoplasmata archaeon]HDD60513.1 hypothetical protein [Euryarchaeota archaeon]
MTHADVESSVEDILKEAECEYARVSFSRGSCFDIIARSPEGLILIRTLTNVENMTKEQADELKKIGKVLSARILVVGRKNIQGEMADDVVYFRFGLPVITPTTLRNLLVERIPIYAFTAPGGIYVNIDGEVLRRARREMGLSLGNIAQHLGVTRRAAKMYEEGGGMLLEAALNLEELLGVPLIKPIDLQGRTSYEVTQEGAERGGDFCIRLSELGFEVTPTKRAPFDAISSQGLYLFFAGEGADSTTTKRKALVMGTIRRIVKRDSVIFVPGRVRRTSLYGTTLISTEELGRMREWEELLELLRDRSPEEDEKF